MADPDRGVGDPRSALAYIGLGSNLGDRLALLGCAARRLAASGGVSSVRLSPVYETDPVGRTEQPPFLNAVAELRTTLAPRDLLALALAIERELGRVRNLRWGPRTIDLDLLTVGDRAIDEPDLQLPHPRLAERAFVLRPLADLAPDLVPPGSPASVRALLARVGETGVRPRRLPADWWRAQTPGEEAGDGG